MTEEFAVQVRDVKMHYKIDLNHTQSMKEFFVNFLRGKMKFKISKALDGVSFDVKKGEILGLVGTNGAGKSTVLKTIGGILKPTSGSVVTKGNIVPMLELGSGFDPDLTGAENIFLNGAILGFTKEFLTEKFDEIVEFSELGDAINSPIRTYSSGMVARLAFSIAVLVRPDIMIVDEILSVGDANFQKKSLDAMLKLMRSGTTVIFVSHSLVQIRELCDRVVWLEKGRVMAEGETEEICDKYAANLASKSAVSVAKFDIKNTAALSAKINLEKAAKLLPKSSDKTVEKIVKILEDEQKKAAEK